MKLTREVPPSGTVRDWIKAHASLAGAAYVFSDGTPALDWSDLHREAHAMACDLTRLGATKGDSIAIMQPNGREGVLAILGTLYGGFRATLINLAAGNAAIAYALEHCDAQIALVHASQKEVFDQTRTAGLQRFEPPKSRSILKLHEVSPGDDALLMYTSGTTGRPKGVVHTHASLLAGGWTTAIAHELTASDRALCVLPICHINGLCVTMMAPLVSGGSVAMCPRFSARQFWQQARDLRVSWFSVVPTIISHLLHGDAEPDSATKTRLRFGRSASAALAPDVQRAFERRFSVSIIETMGLTETAAQILSNPLPPGVRKIGSPGIAFGNEVEIMDHNMAPCPPAVEGEIAVRGPNVMAGYLKNSEATKDTFAGNWLLTGDLGRKDKDGYLFVTGRLKELIIKGGENIAPREIDEALYSHADVIEAAAFARPCQTYGERVEAAVRVREGSALTDEKLRGICVEKLGVFKSPDKIHFMSELPKGASGKIQRMKLVERI